MAIATNSGHVSRAIDFYNKQGKYFSVGRTTPWEDETNPPMPTMDMYKLDELVALKRVDNIYLVVEDEEYGTLTYRDKKWRTVLPEIVTTVGAGGVSQGSSVIPLTSLAGVVVGIKVRVNDIYEGRVISVATGTNTVTLDTPAPEFIYEGSKVLSGAHVEQAKYVYVSCTFSYDDFPIVTYRQIGFHTNVTPDNVDILRSAKHSTTNADEYTSLGNLEIIDHRSPITRTPDQSESVGLIIEF